MAFELWIQRYVEGKSSGTYIGGADIGELEFHGLMQHPGCTNLPGTSTYRLMHKSGVPWLLAELDTPLERPSRIRLSISLTNFKFARAWIDAFDAALDLAQHLNAHLIEGSYHSEVSAENIDEYLRADGEYAQIHMKRWHDALTEMNIHNQAPLEFPLGHLDSVSEYFCLSVQAYTAVTPEKLTDELGYALRLRSASSHTGAIYDPETQRPISKILFRADGKIQLQPFYWKEPFAMAAAETLEIAETIEQKYGGSLYFFSQPVSDELRSALKNRINSLGADFYWWVGEYFRKIHAQ